MQSASSWIWTRVVESISYDDNHYTTGNSYTLYYTIFVYAYIYPRLMSSWLLIFVIDLSVT